MFSKHSINCLLSSENNDFQFMTSEPATADADSLENIYHSTLASGNGQITIIFMVLIGFLFSYIHLRNLIEP